MVAMLRVEAGRFETYGTSHQVVAVLLVAGVVLLLWLGRSYRGTARGDLIGKVFALIVFMVTVPLQLLYFTPDYWDLARTLPLQLCDLASFVAIFALWTQRWWAVGLTYYWGLTLTTQAIITPDLGADFPDPVFLLFWAMHLLVVWAAVYLTWGLGIRPTWRSYRVGVATTAVWAVAVFAFNVVAGTNYGFLNEKPGSASALDLLGPWPWYVAAEIVIVASFWALITWPWVVGSRRRAHAPVPG